MVVRLIGVNLFWTSGATDEIALVVVVVVAVLVASEDLELVVFKVEDVEGGEKAPLLRGGGGGGGVSLLLLLDWNKPFVVESHGASDAPKEGRFSVVLPSWIGRVFIVFCAFGGKSLK